MKSARALLVALPMSLVLAGCGGSDTPVDPGRPGPPPPPPPPTPAAVVLTAGDQQQAAAGSAVPVPPSVTVRDAQGQPVAGVTVQFSVTTGGGQVTGNAPVTNATGTASVTSWVLGPNGNQRLSAQAGSLPAIVFQASITPGTSEHSGTVGSGGGMIAIDEPGHPYHGLTLTVPSGTVTGAADWRFRLAPQPVNIALPAGIRVAGPALEVSTTQLRGNRLMLLEIPVEETDDELMFPVLHDPGRNVIELLPIVDRTPTSVVVATAHLHSSLILGPTPLAAPRAAPGFGRASVTADESVARVARMAMRNMKELATTLEEFYTLMNRWPVRDHGSAAFPDGHGAGIAVLEAVATAENYPGFQGVVRSLPIEGFYAEAAPLAVAQMAQREFTSKVVSAITEVAEKLNQHDKPKRDALVLQNIVAATRLTGRPSIVAGISKVAAGVPVAASVVSGTIGSISLTTPASAQPTQVSVGAGGLGTIALPVVGDGAAHPIEDVVPLSSFTIATEEARGLLASLRRMSQAATDEQRETINRELAAEAGLPDLNVEIQHLPGESWTTSEAANRISFVARSQAAQVRVLASSISVHRPDGSELARTVGNALSVAEDLDLKSAPVGTSIGRTISAFANEAGGAIRQVAVAQMRLISAPFAVEPEEVLLEGEQRTVELTASVPNPPTGGYRIEWNWGDENTTETVGVATASHQYESGGSYDVVATLMTSTDRLKLAVDTIRVRDKPSAWVGTFTSARTSNAVGFTGTLRSEATNVRFERVDSDGSGATRYHVVSGDLTAWNEVPCASYVSPISRVSMSGGSDLQWLVIRETDPSAPAGTPPSSGLWYTANAYTGGLEIFNKVCPSEFNSNPEAYRFATGVVWLNTLDGLSNTPTYSANRNVLQGSVVRHGTDNTTTVWTWRFERVSADP